MTLLVNPIRRLAWIDQPLVLTLEDFAGLETQDILANAFQHYAYGTEDLKQKFIDEFTDIFEGLIPANSTITFPVDLLTDWFLRNSN